MLPSLRSGATTDGGWTREYVDPTSGTVWHLTHLLGELHGGGYQCLIRMPGPTRADLLALVRGSAEPDEVWAAAVLLRDDPESYPELLEALEQAARANDWVRVRFAVEASGIASGMNRRASVGQTVAEIGQDATHFAALAERSRALAAEANAALGPDLRSVVDRVSAPWAAA
jgi:hypothetical protein